MKKNLQTKFSARQYMLSKDFEIYYYDDAASKVESHSHDYYEFYFFLEGDVSIEIERAEYPLTYGDIVLIPPRISHRAVIHSENTPYRRFVFWISEEYCNRLVGVSPAYGYLLQYAQLSREYLFHHDAILFNTVQAKIFQLIEEIQSDRFGKEAKTAVCVSDLLLHLNRTVYEKNHPQSPREEQDLCRSLMQYIEGHLEEELSLQTLADAFYVSKYHIAHVFKENIGMPVHRYILKKRLAACAAAIKGKTAIKEVYLLYGFSDYSVFFRAFKKEYGMSPKEYRDMQEGIAANRS